MVAVSILYRGAKYPDIDGSRPMPDYFIDLNLDQVIDEVASGLDEYRIKPIFYAPLGSLDEIEYRHEVFRDMESKELFAGLKDFAERMKDVRARLASLDKLYQCYREGWFLESAISYCEAIRMLSTTLEESSIASSALSAVREYVGDYASSVDFLRLSTEAGELRKDLDDVRYRVVIKNLEVRVSACDSDDDYADEIERLFEKFRQGEIKKYFEAVNSECEMNHVQARILACVAKLFPGVFKSLTSFRESHDGFMDETLLSFEREIEFYISYLSYVNSLRQSGLPFCLPVFSETVDGLEARGTFDLALAEKLRFQETPIVLNDWHLEKGERILVVTGPNQGGKTTFARAIGQGHHLASIGCPVPGAYAKLLLFDRLFTHFEREETMKSLQGKLLEEIVRLHDSIDAATSRSVLILNEVFTSTTLKDSRFLSKKVMAAIGAIGAFCVCVTFLDELSRLSKATVSLVGAIVPDNPTVKTFKIERREADGLAYALAIAEKHRVTYKNLSERIRS